jgi:hypothetical protein
MTARPQPPSHVIDRVRDICRSLEGAVEHEAWTGTSWRVANTTFVHVVQVADSWPPSYARVFDTAGPATVITFQADLDERHALEQVGPPFYLPNWRPGIVGTVINDRTDWTELTELVTDSHRICAHRQSGRSDTSRMRQVK